MGIRVSSNIKLVKRGNISSSSPTAPAVAPPSRNQRRQDYISSMGEFPEFSMYVNYASKKKRLHDAIIQKIKSTKLFTEKEWEKGITLNFLDDNVSPGTWDRSTQKGYNRRIPFEIYPTGKKKEGRVTGFLQYSPDFGTPNARVSYNYPIGVKAKIEGLKVEEETTKRTTSNGKWTKDEQDGWNQLIALKQPLEITDEIMKECDKNNIYYYNLKGKVFQSTFKAVLGEKFFKTDGSEIKIEGRTSGNYQYDPTDVNNNTNGWGLYRTFRIFRNYHRKETEIEVMIRSGYDSSKGQTLYEIKSVKKV